MSTNYLQAESLLIDHLSATVPQVRAVLSAEDLAGIDESAQPLPAIHVLYDGDTPGDQAGRDRAQETIQRWMIVIALRELRGPGRERRQAGELIGAVLSALAAKRPQGLGRLRRIPGPRPLHTDGGYAYYPLLYALPVRI